jgi:hypothetical protein
LASLVENREETDRARHQGDRATNHPAVLRPDRVPGAGVPPRVATELREKRASAAALNRCPLWTIGRTLYPPPARVCSSWKRACSVRRGDIASHAGHTNACSSQPETVTKAARLPSRATSSSQFGSAIPTATAAAGDTTGGHCLDQKFAEPSAQHADRSLPRRALRQPSSRSQMTSTLTVGRRAASRSVASAA